MKVFMAILSVLCMGGMMSERDKHNKLMWCACFIASVVAAMTITLLQMKVI